MGPGHSFNSYTCHGSLAPPYPHVELFVTQFSLCYSLSSSTTDLHTITAPMPPMPYIFFFLVVLEFELRATCFHAC
jgi:hypothetical protein